jgi:hypothetical protein
LTGIAIEIREREVGRVGHVRRIVRDRDAGIRYEPVPARRHELIRLQIKEIDLKNILYKIKEELVRQRRNKFGKSIIFKPERRSLF